MVGAARALYMRLHRSSGRKLAGTGLCFLFDQMVLTAFKELLICMGGESGAGCGRHDTPK
jgi:hypothetical protein